MRIKNLRFILQGLATYLPVRIPFLPRHQVQFVEDRVRVNTDYTALARACYTNWLRFLTATKPALRLPIESVGEIGPGDCLGVGLAALLSGSKRYYPIDLFPRSRNCDNLLIFDELVRLFENRTPIPDDREFPKAIPKLTSYAFPNILTQEILEKSLAKNRIDAIRGMIAAIHGGRATVQSDGLVISYPVGDQKPVVDFLISIAVMEHIVDPDEAYTRDYAYLKKGGIYAHAIGLNAHGTARQWNGHWTYSPLVWRLIRGRTRYLINRWPHSWHVKSLRVHGLHIVADDVYREKNTLVRKDLSILFVNIPEDDLTAHSVFISGYK